jgi:hypothetical protein
VEEVAKMVKEEEFLAWKLDPVTQAFLQGLTVWKEGLKEQWAAGNFQGETTGTTAMLSVGAQAKVGILEEIIDIDYEQFRDMRDEK